MRGLAHSIYLALFRTQAFLGLALVVWLFSNVPDALAREQYVGVPVLGAVFAGIAAIACLWPFLTPRWLSHPGRVRHLIALVPCYGLLPFLYGSVALNAVKAANLPNGFSQQLLSGMLLPLFLMSGLCLTLGGTLCFWRRLHQADAEDEMFSELIMREETLVPLTQTLPVQGAAETVLPPDASEADFAKLRRARLQRAS